MASLFNNPLSNLFASGGQPLPQEGQSQPADIIKPSQVLIEWVAPERVFKKRPREFYRKMAVIFVFFAIIFVAMLDFLIVLALGVLFFAIYVFHSIPPKDVKHQVTTNGINYASAHMYRWSDLKSFYIDNRPEVSMLVIDTVDPLPGRILLILSKDMDKQKLSQTINQYLSINENPEIGVFDKILSAINKRTKF